MVASVVEESLQCGVLVRKTVVTVLVVFLSSWSQPPDTPCFHKFENYWCLFVIDNALFSCYWYLGVPNN